MSNIKELLRNGANSIDNNNSMKFLIRNLVTRINRENNVNLITVRKIFFNHMENMKQKNINKFINTVNKYFHGIFPVDNIINFGLFAEWLSNRNIENYSDYRVMPLRHQPNMESKQTNSLKQMNRTPLLREKSISEEKDPVWEEILQSIFQTDVAGPTKNGVADILVGPERMRPPEGTPLRDQSRIWNKIYTSAANKAKKERYRRDKPGIEPTLYRGGKKTKRRKKNKIRRKNKKKYRKTKKYKNKKTKKN